MDKYFNSKAERVSRRATFLSSSIDVSDKPVF